MDTETIAARIGVLACIAVLVLVAVPFAVADPGAISVYYDAGLVGPPYFALAAVVAAVALQSGAAGRADPATVAGIAVVFSSVLALLALAWAFGVSASVVGGVTDAAWFEYHRWLVAISACLSPVTAAIYARAVL